MKRQKTPIWFVMATALASALAGQSALSLGADPFTGFLIAGCVGGFMVDARHGIKSARSSMRGSDSQAR